MPSPSLSQSIHLDIDESIEFQLKFWSALFGLGFAAAWLYFRGNQSFKWAKSLESRFGYVILGGEPLVAGLPWLSNLRKPFSIVGKINGLSFHIYEKEGRASHWVEGRVILRMEVSNPNALSFQVTERGVRNAVLSKLDSQTVSTDDYLFEQRLVVVSSESAFLKAALLPELRKLLLPKLNWGKDATLVLKNDALVYSEGSEMGIEDVQMRIERWLSILAALAAIPATYRK